MSTPRRVIGGMTICRPMPRGTCLLVIPITITIGDGVLLGIGTHGMTPIGAGHGDGVPDGHPAGARRGDHHGVGAGVPPMAGVGADRAVPVTPEVRFLHPTGLPILRHRVCVPAWRPEIAIKAQPRARPMEMAITLGFVRVMRMEPTVPGIPMVVCVRATAEHPVPAIITITRVRRIITTIIRAHPITTTITVARPTLMEAAHHRLAVEVAQAVSVAVEQGARPVDAVATNFNRLRF